MKLVSLRLYPDLRNIFADLPGQLLSEADKPFAMKADYTSKILDLKFPVKSEAFLFEDNGGEYFGRILLQGSVLDSKLGHFGMFCLSPDIKYQEMFQKLMPSIEAWFREHGISKIVGPYLYTTFFNYRFRSDSDPARFSWEPNQPASDLEAFKSAGFEVSENYFTNVIENYGAFADKGIREYEESVSLGFKMRPITPESIETDVKVIYDLSMESFKDNYLYAPIPFELFKNIYVPTFKAIDLRLSCIQESPDGRAIGYNFTFVLEDQIVIKSVSVSNEFRGKGLLNAGIRYSMIKARELYPHVRKVATALIHENNGPSKHVANKNNDCVRHEYVLVSKDI